MWVDMIKVDSRYNAVKVDGRYKDVKIEET